jgi:anti-sigma factor (TIGR02949 family)
LSETTCDQVLKEIELFLDGELDPDLGDEVARHLSECRSCFDRAGFQRRVRQLVGMACRTETPAHLWRRVRRALEATP